MTTVSVLVPKEISDAMLLGSSISEGFAADLVIGGKTYALKEDAWSSGTAYDVGDRVYRASTHKIYECVLTAPTTRTLPPEFDAQYWLEYNPTQLWAPFDSITNTRAFGDGQIAYSVQAGFANAICFYGLDGAVLNVQGYTDTIANSGVLFFDSGNINIQEAPYDEYDWLFGEISPLTRYVITGLLPYPNARFDITITAGGGAGSGIPVSVGTIAFGDLVSFVPSDPTWEGPNYGATVQPISFSSIKFNDDGSAKITRRFGASNMHVELQMPTGSGDTALRIMQRVLDVPAAWVGTDAPGYDGLNVFGIGSGQIQYNEGFELLTVDVKGLA